MFMECYEGNISLQTRKHFCVRDAKMSLMKKRPGSHLRQELMKTFKIMCVYIMYEIVYKNHQMILGSSAQKKKIKK